MRGLSAVAFALVATATLAVALPAPAGIMDHCVDLSVECRETWKDFTPSTTPLTSLKSTPTNDETPVAHHVKLEALPTLANPSDFTWEVTTFASKCDSTTKVNALNSPFESTCASPTTMNLTTNTTPVVPGNVQTVFLEMTINAVESPMWTSTHPLNVALPNDSTNANTDTQTQSLRRTTKDFALPAICVAEQAASGSLLLSAFSLDYAPTEANAKATSNPLVSTHHKSEFHLVGRTTSTPDLATVDSMAEMPVAVCTVDYADLIKTSDHTQPSVVDGSDTKVNAATAPCGSPAKVNNVDYAFAFLAFNAVDTSIWASIHPLNDSNAETQTRSLRRPSEDFATFLVAITTYNAMDNGQAVVGLPSPRPSLVHTMPFRVITRATPSLSKARSSPIAFFGQHPTARSGGRDASFPFLPSPLFLMVALAFIGGKGSSQASSSTLMLALVLALVTSSSALPALPACVYVVTPPLDIPVDVCSTPWDHTLGDTPVAGVHSVPIEVNVTVPGLTVTPGTTPTVNGFDVGSTLTADGVYTLNYTTQPGDEEWPWRGLSVSLSLSNQTGSVVVDIITRLVVGASAGRDASSRGMSAFSNALGRGVCMGDVDDDGDVDVFVAMSEGAINQLWINDGSGFFVNQATSRGVAGVSSDRPYCCGFADADADGNVDLFVTRYYGNVNELYMNIGGGMFVEDGSARGVRHGATSFGLDWGDVDGDGAADLYVCNYGGANMLHMNNGAGNFTEEAEPRGVASTREGSASVFDVDGDGDLDVMVANRADQENELFINNGSGSFSEEGAARGFADRGSGPLSIGDFNGDGYVDAVVEGWLLTNNGVGVFTGMVLGSMHGRTAGAKTVMDLEHDGDIDVVVAPSDGADFVWLNRGHGSFVADGAVLGTAASGSTFGIASGDIDGDGDLDMLVSWSGVVYTNHNAQPGVNNWIKVRVLTMAGAEGAFGSSVSLVCSDFRVRWTSLRVVGTGNGVYSLNAYDAHFGLPDPDAVYNISVRWPGDVHPISNWTSHPRLGGVIPFVIPNAQRTFVVRPQPVTLTVGTIMPWDYPGVTTRSGQGPSAPIGGDTVSIPITVSPGHNLHDLNVTATVNGQDISSTWTPTGSPGFFTLTYTTVAGDEEWPWTGLDIFICVVDGGGLTSARHDRVVVGSTFEESAASRGMSALAVEGKGVCFADVDNDGDVDVFVAMALATNQLWINEGSGNFVDKAPGWGVGGDTITSEVYGCAFGDFDADGDMDLVATLYAGGTSALYVHDGGTEYVEEGDLRGVSGTSSAMGPVWADVTGDGALDLFVSSYVANKLFVGIGEGMFAEVAAARGVDTGRSTQAAVAFDCDGDGWLELVLANNGQQPELFKNHGNGFFVDEATTRGLAGGIAAVSVSVMDLNNDGWMDLYFPVFGADMTFLASGATCTFVSTAGDPADRGRGVVTWDMEHDGDLDMLVTLENNPDRVFRGHLRHEYAAALNLAHAGYSYSPAVADIDGDGDLDVVVSRSGLVYVSHNARVAVRNWIKVRPLTAAGAQSAFGCTVRLTCAHDCGIQSQWTGVRVLDGGSGYVSQNAYDAHFGLPDPDASYNISVRWPGDFHPVSNWTSHSRLGGIIPSSVPDAQRTFVVRPHPATLTIGTILPWDYPGVTTRLGQGASAPVAGDTVSVPITVSPTHNLHDISLSSATVNGQNVLGTWAPSSTAGTFTLMYTTVVGDEEWPWTGLDVAVAVADSCGLLSRVTMRRLPGMTFSPQAAFDGGMLSGSITMTDLNGDSIPDVFVGRGEGAPNQLWLSSDTPLAYTNQAAQYGVDSPSLHVHFAAFVDADRDGDMDLHMLSPAPAPDSMFVQDASSHTFVDSWANTSNPITADSRSAWWNDWNGDSLLDFVLCTIGTNLYYRGVGGGMFESVGAESGVSVGSSWSTGCTAADFDDNGSVDVFVGSHEPNQLLRSSGDGTFVAEEVGPSASTTIGALACDADGDGFLDVYVLSAGAGGRFDALLLNDGTGHFSEVVGVGIRDTAYASASDWDHDGVVEVFSRGSILSVRDGVLFTRAALPGFVHSVADFDLDGDEDVLSGTTVYLSNQASPAVASWLRVHPLTSALAPSAYFATVRVACVVKCVVSWVSVQTPHSGTARYQSQYGTFFGLPDPDATYTISVVFPGGATHDNTTDPSLGGIVPSSLTPEERTFVVIDRPYLTSVRATYDPRSSATLPINATITVTLTAGRNRIDLVPASDCCFINGVQVRETFASNGDGTYTLTYVAREGDPTWDAGSLSVHPTLQSASRNLSMVPISYTLDDSPPGDPIPPHIVFSCRPGVASPNVYEPTCMACPGESSCTFNYTLSLARLASTNTSIVPPANMTSLTSAAITVGPLKDDDIVTLVVSAEDGAGNRAVHPPITWRVDTSSPRTTFETKPEAVTSRSDATFALSCSELVCTYAYVLDGGAVTVLGGNSTDNSTDSAMVDTLITLAPRRVSNITSLAVSYTVEASQRLVNATVEVSLGSDEWSLPLDITTNSTEVLHLPALPDGTYSLKARTISSDTVDISPVIHVFTVDTEPPTLTFLDVPSDGDTSSTPTSVVSSNEPDCHFLWRAGPSDSLDSTPWKASLSAVLHLSNVTGGVPHGIQVKGVDPAGNTGPPISTSWIPVACQTIIPAVTIFSDVGVSEGDRHVTFGLAAVDDMVWLSYEYAVDNGPWMHTSRQAITLEGYLSGVSHTLAIRAAVSPACDFVVEAIRPPPALTEWMDDQRPPLEVTIVDGPPLSTPDVFAEFSLVASRRLAWLQYRLDGASRWTSCDSVLKVGPLQPGGHTLEVRAVDDDGGSSGTIQTFEWTITSESESSVILSGLPDGTHTLSVTATDEAGSEEVAPQTHRWRVDTTPPITSALLTSPRYSTTRTAVIDVGCGDEVDPCIFCWTSDTLPSECSFNTSLSLIAPTDGDHAVAIHAEDSVGWVDTSSEVIEWSVDATPPSTGWFDLDDILKPAPSHLASVDYVSPSQTLRLNGTADEAVAGYAVTLHGSVWPTGSLLGTLVNETILAFTALQAVINPITITAVDLAGNKDATPVSLRVLVDLLPPDATRITSTLTTPTLSSSIPVTAASTELGGGSGVVAITVGGVRLEDGWSSPPVSIDSTAGTATLTDLASGTYNVTAAGVDGAGNVDATPDWRLVVVDLDPPTSSFALEPPAIIGSSNLTVWAKLSEAGQVNGGTNGSWVPGESTSAASATVTLEDLTDGLHTIFLRGTDLAGNVESEPYPSVNITVDTTPPVLTWSHGNKPPRYTSAPSTGGCFIVEDATPFSLSVDPPDVTLNDLCLNLTVSDDGEIVINVTATDGGGNFGIPLTSAWTLDRFPPFTVIVANLTASPGCTTVGETVVCPSYSAAQVVFTCSNDGSPTPHVAPCRPQYSIITLEIAPDAGCAPAQPSSRQLTSLNPFVDAILGEPTTLSVDIDGLYGVTLRSIDAAGNVELSNTTLEWYVDTTAPINAPEFVLQPAKVASSRTALFLVRLLGDASPGQSSFHYFLDDGEERPVIDLPSPNTATVQLQLEDLSVAPHKLEVWARDQAGNDGPTTVYTWDIVDTAPDVAILAVPAPQSGDVSPSFVIGASWPEGSTRNGSEPEAAIEVSLGDGFIEACPHTRDSGGLCVWNASLATGGPGTYTLTTRAVFAGVVGDPVTHTWVYRLCSDVEYAVIGSGFGIQCLSCPPGANCAGGLTEQGDLVARPGFWAPPLTTGTTFYDCPVRSACLPGGFFVEGNVSQRVVSRCDDGYTGTLCGVCAPGYFEQFGTCVACGTAKAVAWLITVVVVFVMVGVAVVFFKFRDLLPVDQLKVALSFAQIIASANTAYSIPWPSLFQDFLNVMRIFLIEAVSLTRTSCAAPLTFYSSLVITLVAFKVVTLAVVILPVLIHKWKARGVRHAMPDSLRDAVAAHATPQPARQASVRRSSLIQAMAATVHAAQAIDWAKIFKITFLFLFVAYPGVSLKIMKTFKCVEVEGEFWLVADMRLKCYEGDWYGYALYAFIMGCLYTAGLPLTILIVLLKNRRRLNEASVKSRWGFLYESYGTHAYLWEVVELLRKLWLSALVVLMAEGSPLQVTAAVLISGWAHVLHALYKPWRGVGAADSLYTYTLQHTSLLVTAFVFLTGLLFKVDGVAQDGGTYTFLAWAMVLACAAFVVAAVALLTFSTRAKLRVRRAAVVQAGLKTSRDRRAKGASTRRTTRAAVTAWRGSGPGADKSVASPPMPSRRDRSASMAWRENPLKPRGAAKASAGPASPTTNPTSPATKP